MSPAPANPLLKGELCSKPRILIISRVPPKLALVFVTLNPDGGRNGVVDSGFQGEAYVGRAQVVGQWMMTQYLPLKGPDAKVVRMRFVDLSEAQAFAQQQRKMSGYPLRRARGSRNRYRGL